MIDLKYFKSSDGVSYFLSLHNNFFLVFLIYITTSGAFDVALIQAIQVPDEEFTESCGQIVIAENDRIFLRNESNAHEVDLSAEIQPEIFLKYSLPYQISTIEAVILFLHAHTSDEFNFDSLKDFIETKEHVSALEFAVDTAEKHRNSIDSFGLKALFLSVLRFKISKEKISIQKFSETTSYEILAAYKSDSQVSFFIFILYLYF